MNYRRFGSLLLFGIFTATLQAQDAQRDTVAHTDDIYNPVGRASGPGFELSTEPNSRAYAPGSASDEDLGDQLLLLPVADYRPFSLHGGVEGRWVSNAALTDDGEMEDFYWRYGAGVQYMPHIAGNLYAEVAGDYDWYRYADHPELDFDSLDARAGLVNVFRDLGDLSVWARYNYTRLSEPGAGELFSDHSIEVGAFKPFPIRRDHFLYLGWVSDFSLDADPGYAGRHEHSLLSGYRYSPIDRLELGLFYRFGVLDYDTPGRTDLNHYTGASLNFRLTDHASLRASVSYQLNDSDLAGADYENLGAGGSFGVHIKF